MDRKTRETAARLWFWLQDCKEQLDQLTEPTAAEKRHALALRTKGIVTRDRIIEARTKKLSFNRQ